jgi:hypothetical protein
MTPAQQLDEAQQAQAALDRYLGPAFAAVEAAYMEKLTNIAAENPAAVDSITKLAMAIKISRNVRAQIEAIALGKAEAEAKLDHARQIEKISPHKRGILGI